MIIRVDPERPAPRALRPAVEALQRGEVIVYPTDTGYAFGCAMSSPRGIAALRELKGIHEKHDKPLTMLVNDISALGSYAHVGNTAFRLIKRILPGPFTLVLRAGGAVPRTMRNRDREVGIRVPDHAVCRLLVELLGEPLLTGSLTPGENEPALEELEELEPPLRGSVKLFVDAGPLWPDPSTVIRLTEDVVEVLRQGQGQLPE